MKDRNRLQNAIFFILLTFLITWSVNIPLALAAHGIIKFSVPHWVEIASTLSPGIVAIILAATQIGEISFKELLLKTIKWRIKAKWYIFSLLIPIVFVVASLWIYHSVFSGTLDLSEWYLPFILFFIFLPFSPIWEELGWRGFLLPLLQSKFSPLIAATILGLIWGIWHIPMYLVHNPEGVKTGVFLVYFVLGTIPITVLFVWLFNSTKGSLTITIIFHAAINATFSLFSKLPTGELRPFIYCIVFFSLTAFFVVYKTNGRLESK